MPCRTKTVRHNSPLNKVPYPANLDSSSSPEDLKFDQVISAMQEIVIDETFELMLTKFMYDYWYILDQGDKNEEKKVFEQYRAELQIYLQSVFHLSIVEYRQIYC